MSRTPAEKMVECFARENTEMEEALLEDTSSDETKRTGGSATVSVAEFKLLKEQNNAILEKLSKILVKISVPILLVSENETPGTVALTQRQTMMSVSPARRTAQPPNVLRNNAMPLISMLKWKIL